MRLNTTSAKFGAAILCAILGSSAAQAVTTYNIDLKPGGATTDPTLQTILGTRFQQGSAGSGSGVYTRVFAVQQGGTERGFNNNVTAQYDQKNGVGDPALLLSSLPVVTISGATYVQFTLDVNDKAGLTLTDLRFYLLPTGAANVTVTNEFNPDVNFGTPTWALNGIGGAIGVNELNMTELDTGSGYDDMTISIPTSLFGSTLGTQRVYLWGRFTSASGGFEEFAFNRALVPEAATAWGGASIAVLLFGGLIRRRRTTAPAQGI